MASSVEMCAICAWRATCNKKYNLSGRDMHCADFSEDISITRKSDEDGEAEDSVDE